MRDKNLNKISIFKEKIVSSNSVLPLQLQFMNTTFLHGSSSAVFACFAPLGIKHLIPTGILRKVYDYHPFSGELGLGTLGLHGRRKGGINYRYLSGFADSAHIESAISYSRSFSHFDKDKAIRSFSKEELGNITNLPLESECFVTRRIHLKRLQMRLQNLMLMEESWLDIKDEILIQLEKSLAENIDSPLTLKYLLNMIDVIKFNRLPFTPDARFRDLIQNQFPIVWVSKTLQPIPFGKGVPGEHLIEGAIDLSNDIQEVITPAEHVEQLRSLLEEHGLNHITIHSYHVIRVEEIKESVDYETLAEDLSNTTIPHTSDYLFNDDNAHLASELKAEQPIASDVHEAPVEMPNNHQIRFFKNERFNDKDKDLDACFNNHGFMTYFDNRQP